MFFVVESGELSVEVHGEPVSTMGPGSSFGEIALIDRRPRTATVTASTRSRRTGCPSSSSDRSSSRARGRLEDARGDGRPARARRVALSVRDESWPELFEVGFARADRLRGDRLRTGDGLEHPPAEDDAANAGRAPLRNHAGRLPLRGRAVDLALAGDDEVAFARRASNPMRSRTVGAPGTSGRRVRRARRRARRPRRRRGARRRARAPPCAASRRSSSGTSAGAAPFCGPNRRAASASVVRTSQSTVVGTGSARSTSRSPAPPSTVALPPRPTSSAGGDSRAPRGRARRARDSTRRAGRARRERAAAARSPAAASSTARPSGSTSQRAGTGPSQRIGNDGLSPVAAERRVEHVRSSPRRRRRSAARPRRLPQPARRARARRPRRVRRGRP